MSTTNIPNLSAVFTAVRAFLQYIVPLNTEVIQGLDNRVSPPTGPHVAVTAIVQQRLATNIERYADPTPTTGTRAIQQNTRVEVQLDFYGPNAGDWAAMAETLWRDEQGCALLGETCQPLEADTAIQAPFVTGEQQYEARWILRAFLQYNPVVTLPQQFADAANVALINVDERYPP